MKDEQAMDMSLQIIHSNKFTSTSVVKGKALVLWKVKKSAYGTLSFPRIFREASVLRPNQAVSLAAGVHCRVG